VSNVPTEPDPTVPSRSTRRWLIVTIVVAPVLLLAMFVGMAFAIVTVTNSVAQQAKGDSEPVIEGDAGAAEAVNPLVCDGRCFTAADVGDTISTKAELDELGLPDMTAGWGSYSDSTPSAELRYAQESWTENKASPDACFFTRFEAPVAFAFTDTPAFSTELVNYTGVYSNSSDLPTEMTQAVRIFADAPGAVTHMATMADNISGCTGFTSLEGAAEWSPSVTASAAITVPDSVAAVGWVERMDGFSFYGYDVQRGNLVVRTRMFTPGDISERDYRVFVEQVAARVGGLPN